MFSLRKKIIALLLSSSFLLSSHTSFAAQLGQAPVQNLMGAAANAVYKDVPKDGLLMKVSKGIVIASTIGYLGSSIYEFAAKYGFVKTEHQKKLEKALLSNLSQVNKSDTTHRSQLIFNKKTKHQLNALVQQMIERSKNNQSLPNVLLHGPSGTGKTATVKAFVHDGFDVWVLPGQSITRPSSFQFLKTWIKEKKEKSKKPMIILVDEAEVLFNRLNAGRHNELVNTFLTELGTPSNKVSWWFTANSTLDLWLSADQAIERRFGYMKLVDRPDLKSRLEIFSQNYNKMAETLKKQKNYQLSSLKELFAEENLLINDFKEETKGYSADFMRMLGTHYANMISPKNSKEKNIQILKTLLKKEIEDQKNMEAAVREELESKKKKLIKKAELNALMKAAYSNDEDEDEDEDEDKDEDEDESQSKGRKKRRK